MAAIEAARPKGLRNVIVVAAWTAEVAAQLTAAFDPAATPLIALDCEGVDLSRLGVISLVQLMSPAGDCFLIDVLPRDPELIDWLRALLENPKVVKIIHDCRMDADALQHHLKIKLVNVHDTSCWHAALTGQSMQGLNSVLTYNGLPTNSLRDNSIYDRMPPFWLTRPLTPQMTSYASQDLASSFLLHDRQRLAAAGAGSAAVQGPAKSQAYLYAARLKLSAIVSVNNMGKFIGQRGANINRLQEDTGTLIYKFGFGKAMGGTTFMVFYTHDSDLQQVKAAGARQ